MGRPKKKISTKQAPKQAPKKDSEYIEKFWRGNVFIKGIGVVNGKVRNDHLEKFKSEQRRIKALSKLAEQDQPTFNIDDWIKDTDLLEEKRQKDRKASKEKFK